MAAKALLAALAAFGGSQPALALLRSSAWGDFLVDNSELQHKGPGVLLRRSKSLSDTAGRKSYVEWGAVLNATDSSDGWVQYQDYYLPTHVRGKRVLKRLESPSAPSAASTSAQPAQPALRKQRLAPKYLPTELKMPDGSWVSCRPLGEGSMPDTWNVEVQPKTFAPYLLNDVPAAALKKIKSVRAYIPLEPAKASTAAKFDDATATISLKVEDAKGRAMQLKMFRKSPLRTIMKMACERAGMSWFRCQRTMRFTLKEKPVQEGDSVDALGLQDGDSLSMLKK